MCMMSMMETMKQFTCVLLVMSLVDPTIATFLISIMIIYNGLHFCKRQGINEYVTYQEIEESTPHKEDVIGDITEILKHLKISS